MSHQSDISLLCSSAGQEGEAPDGGAQRRRPGPEHSGAPPSNTAPGNCINSNSGALSILRFGVDSVYFSFPGKLAFNRIIEFEHHKKLAQSPSKDEQSLSFVAFDKHLFVVHGHGSRRFAYILENDCYRLQLAGAHAQQLPMAYVKVASKWLLHKGVGGVVEELKAFLEPFRAETDLRLEPRISRADLYADFLSPIPINSWDEDAWVCRSRSIDKYHREGQLSGWVVGAGGDIACRLYDKTLEIKLSKKDYLKPLWHQAGWEPPAPVYRLEFQLRRQALRDLGIDTVDSLLSRERGLWEYLTQSWLRLTLPNPHDSTQTRWPTHPLWEELQRVPWEGTDKVERIDASPLAVPHDKHFATHHLSLLAGYMAREGIQDPQEGAIQLHDFVRAYYNSHAFLEGADFDRRVQERVALKRLAYGLQDAETLKRRGEVLAEAVKEAILEQADAYRKESDGE